MTNCILWDGGDEIWNNDGSPCMDAGDNMAVPADEADLDGDGDTTERTPFDLERAPRFVDDPSTEDTGVPDPPDYVAVVDMGAYEYQPSNPGDFDDDGDVDLDDYSTLATCMTGPNGGVPPDCHPADLDQDDDVDLQDMARFEIAFAGR